MFKVLPWEEVFTMINYPLRWNIKDTIWNRFQSNLVFPNSNFVNIQTNVFYMFWKMNDLSNGYGLGKTTSGFPPSLHNKHFEGGEFDHKAWDNQSSSAIGGYPVQSSIVCCQKSSWIDLSLSKISALEIFWVYRSLWSHRNGEFGDFFSKESIEFNNHSQLFLLVF